MPNKNMCVCVLIVKVFIVVKTKIRLPWLLPQPKLFFHFHWRSKSISFQILKGAKLASATVPWHWLFFCLASKLCYENLPRNYDTQKNLSKKLWSLEVGLVDFSPEWRPCRFYTISFSKRTSSEISSESDRKFARNWSPCLYIPN